MNSLNEYTFQVIEAVRPEIHDDDVLDERYIKDLIHQQRHIWLKRDIEKGRQPSEVMIQDLGCVEIEPASAVECCDYQSECTVMRTKLELPTPISFGTRLGIEYVGPLDPSAPEFSTMTFKRSKFFGNGRFNKDGIAFNYRNNRGYLISKNPALPLLEKISVRMILENPSDAAYFKHCSGDPCYTDDSPYPMPSSIWPFMKEYIMNMLLNKERIPNDTTNDGRKTSQQQTIQK